MNSISFNLSEEIDPVISEVKYRKLDVILNDKKHHMLNIVSDYPATSFEDQDFSNALMSIKSLLESGGKYFTEEGLLDPYELLSHMKDCGATFRRFPDSDLQIIQDSRKNYYYAWGMDNKTYLDFGFIFYSKDELDKWICNAKSIDPTADYCIENV
jgi:hypothetical protein